MERRTRTLLAVAGAVALVLAVQLGALALVAPFEASPLVAAQTPEDPTDPRNSLLYIGLILVATAVMLAAIRLGRQWVIRGLVVLTSGWITWFVLAVLLPPVTVAGVAPLPLAGGVLVAAGLVVHPEWYVIDAAGVVMGAGIGALFGVSFGLLPAVVLLSVLAVYDAVSVYGTEHMLALAEGVMGLNVPVLLVVPVTTGFSMLDGGKGTGDGSADADETAEPGGAGEATAGAGTGEEGASMVEQGPLERDALFLGLGDAVIPTVMVASAAAYSAADPVRLAGVAVKLPALTAVAGTTAGLLALLWLVLRGRAHAGLPLLNGGAILGYLLGALASGITLVEALGLGPYL